MRTVASIVVGVAVVVAVSGCGGASRADQDEVATPVETRESPAAPAGEQPAQQWVMPNLVGAVLQDAQDQIQGLTGSAIHFTGSHDLGGQDRNQVLDANWQVCTQNIAPGAALTPGSRVDFGVVKLDEVCP
ncbi:hypothetical protein [Actinophytocola xinjiangensis]|uniref:hypothetical protein n=1 Tax=Actinophytocola xinjiangensis TaxID=485602 RepID=UPI001B80119D|nr:hypothetical protein [Actinophytocola xinjiangensis]